MADARSSSATGLTWILGATAIAGAVGYVIQLIAPAALVDPEDYVAFSVFWSTLYLMVGAVGGLQQEVARASSTESRPTSSHLRTVALSAASLLGLLAAAVGLVIGPGSFPQDGLSMSLWLGVGIAGYALVAIFSGVLYGVRAWRIVAALTLADALIRGALVTLGLLAHAPTTVLAAAISLPFGLAFCIVWVVARRRVIGSYSLDVSLRTLVRNALGTVLAAAATGVVVTGLPLVLTMTASQADTVIVATLISVITITRAPLIVPLFALQSYLVVTFRDSRALARPLGVFGSAIAACTAVGMVVAYYLGPVLISAISAGRFVIDPWPAAMIVMSAGLVALVVLTGSVLLARSLHAVYVAGWIVAAAATVGLLLLPADPIPRTICALLAAPALALGVHVVALLRSERGVARAVG